LKLLLDENLSDRLVEDLRQAFGDCTHVRLVGLAAASDDEVWRYARDSGCTIVSKDSDFHQRVLLEGPPPKIVWVRRGNCSTREIFAVLKAAREDIQHFTEDADLAFLVLE
jgi:predicted nuclease of predicted toxin-antitoxin system